MNRQGLFVIHAVFCAFACSFTLMAASPASAQTAPEASELELEIDRLMSAGQASKAIPLAEKVLELRLKEWGPDHPVIGIELHSLGVINNIAGRPEEAARAFKQSRDIRKNALGPNHPDVAKTLNDLAAAYELQRKYADAIKALIEALSIFEALPDNEPPDVAMVLNNLGNMYHKDGQLSEAIDAYERALTIRTKVLSPVHPDIARTLHGLGNVYTRQYNVLGARAAFTRALEIREEVLQPDHPDIARLLTSIGFLDIRERKFADAKRSFSRALSIQEKVLRSDHPDVAQSLNGLGIVSLRQGDQAAAIESLTRAVALLELQPGNDPLELARTLHNLALMQLKNEELSAANASYTRALAILETALEPEHTEVAATLNGLATLYLQQQDWGKAQVFGKRATAILEKQTTLAATSGGRLLIGDRRSEPSFNRRYFVQLVKAVYRADDSGIGGADETAHSMFLKAQWAQTSEAAASTSKMAGRSAMSDPKSDALIREREKLDAVLSSYKVTRHWSLSDQRDEGRDDGEKAVTGRMVELEKKISEIDATLDDKLKGYAALVNTAADSIKVVQNELSYEQALILTLDTNDSFKPLPEETFVWVVTKTDVRWARSDLGTQALLEEVTALRCGLDAAAWEDEADEVDSCPHLLGLPEGRARPDPLPFDHVRAHALYEKLFGEVKHLIADKKHLLIVPSGALTQLPFHALVSRQPGPGTDHRSRHWLARDHAITVLPAVSSLRALRQGAKPSKAERPMLAFANPALDGDATDQRLDKQLKLSLSRSAALYRQSCDLPPSREELLLAKSSDRTDLSLLGPTATADDIRRWTPVPETARLVCDIAADPNFAGSRTLLSTNATEKAVRELNAAGELGKYRIIQFATHGAIAGQVDGIDEPGLVLTPPPAGAAKSSDDDGYLTAAEITELELDADWVILSACNTAAGGETGGEALSGLARAFIYAGARALLVSHWSVYERAAVKLVTGAARRLSEAGVGRAEAMRQAMVDLIDNGEPHEAHPAYWAPFVVVGEGAAARP